MHVQDMINSYSCTCQVGYTGLNCETEVNECAADPCVHGNCTVSHSINYTKHVHVIIIGAIETIFLHTLYRIK